MSDPSETGTVNTKATAPVIPFMGTERGTKPVTPREKSLETPISTILGTPYPSAIPKDTNMFHHI